MLPTPERNPVCEFLEWDSQFFGFRIGRVRQKQLRRESAAAALAWASKNRMDCLYLLTPDTEEETQAAAVANGFRQVDVRLTFARAPESDATGIGAVRPFRQGDEDALRAIARTSHTDSRFYYDTRFPRERCDALYDTWIRRSCDGWAQTVLVAESAGRAAGYLSCHLSEGAGSIGLVAVEERCRGLGLGRQLVRAALKYFHAEGMKRVTVVTQGRNQASQRLYRSCGFQLETSEVWYHWWKITDEQLPNSV